MEVIDWVCLIGAIIGSAIGVTLGEFLTRHDYVRTFRKSCELKISKLEVELHMLRNYLKYEQYRLYEVYELLQVLNHILEDGLVEGDEGYYPIEDLTESIALQVRSILDMPELTVYENQGENYDT